MTSQSSTAATGTGLASEGAAPDFWYERWRDGQTGWDQGGPHPSLTALLSAATAAGLPRDAAILEPGSGRAHNGATLARAGYTVTCFDLAADAIARARELYADVPRLTLAVADALVPRREWRGRFNAIFDRAFLCALPPGLRRAYLAACREHLAPGGLFLSLPFIEVTHADGRRGPPFEVRPDALAVHLGDDFSMVTADVQAVTADGKIKYELIAVWRRRAAVRS